MPLPPEAAHDKARLRAQLSQRCRAVDPTARAAAAAAVARHLEASPEYARCRRLVVYWALPDELPLAPVIEGAVRDGKHVLWPRVVDPPGLAFAPVDRVEQLVPSRYGVREPPEGSRSEMLGVDALVLVPGVAFDLRGGRLGRGGGLWDRSLARLHGVTSIGVGYEMQVIERVPREAHDMDLSGLLTEVGLRRFAHP